MAGGCWRRPRSRCGGAGLPGFLDGARDDVHHPARDRCGSPTRDGRWAPGGGARVDGITGRVRMRTELVLRPEYGLAIPCLRSDGRDCSRWPAPTPTARQPRADERGPVAQRGRLHRRRRAGVPFALVWHAALDGHRTGVGRRGAGPRGPVLVDVGGRMHLRPRLATPGVAVPAHVEGADLRADRGAGRRGDHVAAQGDRGGPQLGLPVLLAADAAFTLQSLSPEGSDRGRSRGGLAGPGCGGHPAQLQVLYGVGGERGCPRPRCRGCPATRAQGRAGRQRRSPAVPLDVYGESSTPWPRPPARSPTDGDVRRPSADAAGVPRKRWRDPDDGIWEVRAASPLHPLQGDGLGGRGPGRAVVEVDRWGRTAGAAWPPRSTPTCATEASTPTPARSCRPTEAGAWTLRAGDAVVGFCPPSDARVAATVAAVENPQQ